MTTVQWVTTPSITAPIKSTTLNAQLVVSWWLCNPLFNQINSVAIVGPNSGSMYYLIL